MRLECTRSLATTHSTTSRHLNCPRSTQDLKPKQSGSHLGRAGRSCRTNLLKRCTVRAAIHAATSRMTLKVVTRIIAVQVHQVIVTVSETSASRDLAPDLLRHRVALADIVHVAMLHLAELRNDLHRTIIQILEHFDSEVLRIRFNSRSLISKTCSRFSFRVRHNTNLGLHDCFVFSRLFLLTIQST